MASFTLFDGSTIERTLLDGETGFVAQTGSLATFGAAITASGSARAVVLGSLFSEDEEAVSHAGASLELNVGSDGAVGGSDDDDGVSSEFTSSVTISNDGYLFAGEDALDLRATGPGGRIDVFNAGTVSGGSDGMVTGAIDGLTRIANGGEIVGADGGIDHLDGDAFLTNRGSLVGGDYAYDGSEQVDELRNFGSMEGGVLTYGGDDIVRNAGFIDFLDLGEGDDFYHGRGGVTETAVEGGGGADFLRGGGDDDELLGGDDSDEIQGRAGEDFVSGGRGGDVLSGGRGDDELRGDRGADVFRFAANHGFDTILDLRRSDDIDLTALGLRSFGRDLDDTIRDAEGGSVIDLSDERGLTIFVEGVEASSLNANDFLI